MIPRTREPRPRTTPTRRRLVAVAALAACLAAAPGCLPGIGGPKNFENDNDRLRAETIELERRVASLEAEVERRIGEARSLRAALNDATGRAGLDPSIEVPTLATVELDRLTGPVDDDDDGTPDAILAYVRTLDQRGRFLPVAAEAALLAVVLDADAPTDGPNDAADVIARLDVGFVDFDAAFRSGLTGTHHTLRLALPAGVALPEEATLRVELTPAGSSAEFAAQRVVRLRDADDLASTTP